jgi:hypothetical protein
MRRERVGESREILHFGTAAAKISVETPIDADVERNPNNIPVFIPSFSDVP